MTLQAYCHLRGSLPTVTLLQAVAACHIAADYPSLSRLPVYTMRLLPALLSVILLVTAK